MCGLCDFENIKVVLKSEVNDYFDITAMHNVTNKEITLEDFTEEQIDFIKRAYASDYAFLEKYGVKKNGNTKSKRKNG